MKSSLTLGILNRSSHTQRRLSFQAEQAELNLGVCHSIQWWINKRRLRGELSCASVGDILGFISLQHLCLEQVRWLLRGSQKDSRGPQSQKKNGAGEFQERSRCNHNQLTNAAPTLTDLITTQCAGEEQSLLWFRAISAQEHQFPDLSRETLC